MNRALSRRRLSKLLVTVAFMAGSLDQGLAFGSNSMAGPDSGPRCTETISFSPGNSYHHPGAAKGETVCYRFEAPEAGFLIVAAVALGPDGGTDLLLHSWSETQDGDMATAVIMARSASHLALWTRGEGDAVLIEVASADPADGLRDHAVSGAFLSEADLVAMVGPAAPGVIQEKDGEDGEIDPILSVAPSPGDASAPFDLRTWVPGIYTVLVEGSPRKGSYALIFASLRW